MRLVSLLLGKLTRRPGPPLPDGRPHERDRLLAFAEFLAVAAYGDFGGLPLEAWPGYRDAVRDEDPE